jgi:plasmid stability protein
MVPKWLEPVMPTTLTLKNIPDEVYERLRAKAALNRRSLNSEAIVCLETVLNLRQPDAERQLAHIRSLRAALGNTHFDADVIDDLKRKGRK